jgi:hypothetical protein
MQMPLKSQQEILYSIFMAIILNIVKRLTPFHRSLMLEWVFITTRARKCDVKQTSVPKLQPQDQRIDDLAERAYQLGLSSSRL